MQREHSTGSKPVKWGFGLIVLGASQRRNPGIKCIRLRAICFGEQARDASFLAGNHVGGRWLIPST